MIGERSTLVNGASNLGGLRKQMCALNRHDYHDSVGGPLKFFFICLRSKSVRGMSKRRYSLTRLLLPVHILQHMRSTFGNMSKPEQNNKTEMEHNVSQIHKQKIEAK